MIVGRIIVFHGDIHGKVSADNLHDIPSESLKKCSLLGVELRDYW